MKKKKKKNASIRVKKIDKLKFLWPVALGKKPLLKCDSNTVKFMFFIITRSLSSIYEKLKFFVDLPVLSRNLPD